MEGYCRIAEILSPLTCRSPSEKRPPAGLSPLRQETGQEGRPRTDLPLASQDIRAQGWETEREGAPLSPGRCRRLPLLGLARSPAQKAAVPALAHPAAAARRGARSGCGPVAAAECGALGASAAPGRTQPSLSTPGTLRALVGSVPAPHSTPAHLPHPHRLCRPAAPPSAPSPQRASL